LPAVSVKVKLLTIVDNVVNQLVISSITIVTNKISRRRQTSPPYATTWRTPRNISIVCDSDPFAALCDDMTSSTLAEVNKVSP